MNSLKNYTILYVEDDLNVQKNIAEYLRRYFKEVFVASDGEEGLELYKKYRPNAMLLDIDIPYINGLELAKEIRREDKNISITILTAYTDRDKLLKATELKLAKYLVKPVDLNSFKESLELMAKEIFENNQDIIQLGGGYSWNKEHKRLYKDLEKIPLSAKEQILLELLINNRGDGVSFATIMAEVWVDEFEKEVSFNSVKNLVSSLRKKLPKNSIVNVYSQGYMFN